MIANSWTEVLLLSPGSRPGVTEDPPKLMRLISVDVKRNRHSRKLVVCVVTGDLSLGDTLDPGCTSFGIIPSTKSNDVSKCPDMPIEENRSRACSKKTAFTYVVLFGDIG
ncbi:hypothetical protein TNCV_3661011 [Trichonephila clavipes]|nr:hypothetical protein TNCV_3661011 [Trichonephila clavipes]